MRRTVAISGEQFITDEKGRRTGVLLSMKRYNKILEDIHDLAVIAERREEESISLDEMRNRLRANGII